jgi:uncharacterized hydrophobic protein (TIGR00271 family)
MMHVRLTIPAELTAEVLDTVRDNEAVSSLTVARGAAIIPTGDVVELDVAREGVNAVIEALHELGVHERGTVQVEPVTTWLSRGGFVAERLAPGAGSDSVVWAEVTQQAYEDSELTWSYAAFMVIATSIASIAIILDSQVLVIGAMILGPEFGAVAALGLALVRRRPLLFFLAARTLVAGFLVAIVVVTLLMLLARGTGFVTLADVSGPRPETAFVYHPDRWSFVVALIAAAAGVLSLATGKLGGLTGAFVSVTTIPAAGNVAVGLAFGLLDEVRGSSLQLLVNLSGMALAGWVTLAVTQAVWKRVDVPQPRLIRWASARHTARRGGR